MIASKHIELKKYLLNLFAINLALFLLFSLSNSPLEQFLLKNFNFNLAEEISSVANDFIEDSELNDDEFFQFINFVPDKFRIELKDYLIRKLQVDSNEGESVWQNLLTNFKS